MPINTDQFVMKKALDLALHLPQYLKCTKFIDIA